MKILGNLAAILTAFALTACNDQRPASAMPTPAPGESQASSTATPVQNPAGGTTGGTGGQAPAQSAQTYPPTETVK